jgi:hypothetical protein
MYLKIQYYIILYLMSKACKNCDHTIDEDVELEDTLTYNRMRSVLTITSPKLSEKIKINIHSLPPPKGKLKPRRTPDTLCDMIKYVLSLKGVKFPKLNDECLRLEAYEQEQLLIDVGDKLMTLYPHEHVPLMKNLMKTAKTFNVILPNETELFKKALNIQLDL